MGNFGISIDDPAQDELAELAGRLNQMAQQLESTLETRREFAILEERNRLARDLHDSAKQLAFAAAGQINAANNLLKRDTDAAGEHIEEAEGLIRNLRRELGDLIRQLRPAELEGKGLGTALGDYAADWSRQTGIAQEVLVRRERHLPLDIEQAIFRIMQEALANSARHSHANEVKIKIVYGNDDITCTLHDDGLGFDPGQKFSGFGLHSMRERAAAVGGTLRIESAPDSGTTLMINIPTSQKGAEDEETGNE
jgi:NarL family two-component system sensor histidine kinase LiaS